MSNETKINNGEAVFILTVYGKAERAIKGRIVECISHCETEADEYRILGEDNKIYELYYPNFKNEVVYMLTRREYINHLKETIDNNCKAIEALEQRNDKLQHIMNTEIEEFRRGRQAEKQEKIELCAGEHDFGEWAQYTWKTYEPISDDLNTSFRCINNTEWHRQCRSCGYYEVSKENPNLETKKSK